MPWLTRSIPRSPVLVTQRAGIATIIPDRPRTAETQSFSAARTDLLPQIYGVGDSQPGDVACCRGAANFRRRSFHSRSPSEAEATISSRRAYLSLMHKCNASAVRVSGQVTSKSQPRELAPGCRFLGSMLFI